MRKIAPFSGWAPQPQDFVFMEQTGVEALRRRFKDYWTLPGVKTGLLVVPGPTVNSVSVTTGVGYDRNAEECVLETVETLEFANSNGVTYYVRLTFNYRDVNPVYHSKTGVGPNPLVPNEPYLLYRENYYTLSISTSAPSVDDPDILLATILGSGSNTFVVSENINNSVRTIANIPQASLQQLDHTLFSNIGANSHAEIDSSLSQLFADTGITKGTPLTTSLLDQITTALSGNLDNLYISKTSAFYDNFNIGANPSTHTVTWSAGKLFYRGVIYDVDITPATLGPVTPGTPKLIVGTTSLAPNTVVFSLENLSIGVQDEQIVVGLYNGNDDLFLWYGNENPVVVRQGGNATNLLKITDNKIDSNDDIAVNRQLYLNSNSTTAPVSVGNGATAQLNLGSGADTARLLMDNSGEEIILSPKSSGTTNKIYLSKADKSKTDLITLASEQIVIEDDSTTVTSIFPPNGVDFSTTPGAYARKDGLSVREQLDQIYMLNNLYMYSEDGVITWNGTTQEVTIANGIKIVNFFTGATLTCNLTSNPFPITQNNQILYVDWNLRQTQTKSIQTRAVNTPSFFPTPSVGENANQDEYRIVLAIRVPAFGGGDPRLLIRTNTFA